MQITTKTCILSYACSICTNYRRRKLSYPSRINRGCSQQFSKITDTTFRFRQKTNYAPRTSEPQQHESSLRPARIQAKARPAEDTVTSIVRLFVPTHRSTLDRRLRLIHPHDGPWSLLLGRHLELPAADAAMSDPMRRFPLERCPTGRYPIGQCPIEQCHARRCPTRRYPTG